MVVTLAVAATSVVAAETLAAVATSVAAVATSKPQRAITDETGCRVLSTQLKSPPVRGWAFLFVSLTMTR